jgi:hypothetical protein
MIEIVAIADGQLGGGGVDEQMASKVVVRCVAQVEPSPPKT